MLLYSVRPLVTERIFFFLIVSFSRINDMLLELLDGRLVVDILGLLTRKAKSGLILDFIVNATASKILDVKQETLFLKLV